MKLKEIDMLKIILKCIEEEHTLNEILWYILRISILLIMAIIMVFFHELGHAIFVKIFGGKVKKITIGRGNNLLNLGKFEIKKRIFRGGMCTWEDNNFKNITIVGEVCLILGGVFINVILGCIFYYLYKNSNGVTASYCRLFSVLNFMYFIQNLIPITSRDGVDYDGKRLYLILKNRKLDSFEALKK